MPERIKKLKKILYFVEQFSNETSINMSLYYDFELQTTFNSSDPIPGNGSYLYNGPTSIYNGSGVIYGEGTSGEIMLRKTLSGQARYVQVRFTNTKIDQQFRVRGFTIMNKPKSMR